MSLLWSVEPVTVRVRGSDAEFPVRRIYCVGRNYVDHIREMKEGDERDDPFFFQKPTDAVVADSHTVAYPPDTADLQFEGELVVAVGKPARAVGAESALDVIYGYAAGIDLTRRDRQKDALRQSRPWEPGKAFDQSAPCGAIVPATAAPGVLAGSLELSVNGVARQRTTFDLMIWKVPEIIARLSAQYALEPGDLIYTGTPAGVGAVHPGDDIEVRITDLPALHVTIGPKEQG